MRGRTVTWMLFGHHIRSTNLAASEFHRPGIQARLLRLHRQLCDCLERKRAMCGQGERVWLQNQMEHTWKTDVKVHP